MKFRDFFISSIPMILLALSGCKGGTSLSDRRVPVINQQYISKEKRIEGSHSSYNKSDENYYAFNTHQMPVSYFEEKKTKEVFHPSPKKSKKKKPAKIYKKLPKKEVHKPQNNQKTKREDNKNIVKIKPKEDKKLSSDRSTKIKKSSKKKAKVLNPSKSRAKEINTNKLKPIKTSRNRNNVSKKPKYDPIEWPKDKSLPSRFELEKDVAYLEQDMMKKERGNLAKLKPKSKTIVSSPMKDEHNKGDLDTYDVESRPIPLPFK